MLKTKMLLAEVLAALLSLMVAPVCLAQQFTWTRTGQAVGTNGSVQIWTGQGGQTIRTTDPDPNPNDDIAAGQAVLWPPAVTLPGGAGGAGGAGAAGGPAANGDDGDAGMDGEETARAKTDGISQLNANNEPNLNWSYIHNQTGELKLIGSAGGGGGGGGGGWADPVNPMNFGFGQDGDNGGDGVVATAWYNCNHTSTVAVTATLQGPAQQTTTASININLGWVHAVSQVNPSQYLGNINNFTVTAGNASAWVAGTTGNPATITGVDGNGNFIFRSSTSNLGDPTGSVALGPNDLTDVVGPGAQATINASVFSGMTRGMTGGQSGIGGGGGGGGWVVAGFDGADGTDGGPPIGTIGGLGGTGGAGAGDGQPGGNGGQGGDGAGAPASYGYIFQGVVDVVAASP